jgi:hypothetical protein
MIDLKLGGTIDHGDGRLVEIQPHSQREYLGVLGTTIYEFFFYEEQQSDEPSDRIQILITDRDGCKQGWLMNVEDAIILIRGLSQCCLKAISASVPVAPSKSGSINPDGPHEPSAVAILMNGGDHAHNTQD